ncbi:hypothetical protein TIFTF001_029997 [Ficus carica]|uniref:Uncharacterized protein n=1 Tax=Ficus carica TaxID=3494 RepID=A0AA88DSW1_FICCA|nr:hypothetical protein TIFTF001_029997 [Ficus carica]
MMDSFLSSSDPAPSVAHVRAHGFEGFLLGSVPSPPQLVDVPGDSSNFKSWFSDLDESRSIFDELIVILHVNRCLYFS